jgi:hypothetical protein
MNTLNKNILKTFYILRSQLNNKTSSKLKSGLNIFYNNCLKKFNTNIPKSIQLLTKENYDKILKSVNLNEDNLNLNLGCETILTNLVNSSESLVNILESSENDEYLKEELIPKIISFYALAFNNLTQLKGEEIESENLRIKLNSILSKFIFIAMSVKVDDKLLWDSFYQIYVENIENLGKRNLIPLLY